MRLCANYHYYLTLYLVSLLLFSLIHELGAQRHLKYYQMLEVPVDATEHQIRRAYRKLSHKWHPDRATNQDEAGEFHENMIKINNAFETLVDSNKRAEYDQFGEEGAPSHHGFNGFHDVFANMPIFHFGGGNFGGGNFGGHRGDRGKTCMQTTTCSNGICTVRTVCQ